MLYELSCGHSPVHFFGYFCTCNPENVSQCLLLPFYFHDPDALDTQLCVKWNSLIHLGESVADETLPFDMDHITRAFIKLDAYAPPVERRGTRSCAPTNPDPSPAKSQSLSFTSVLHQWYACFVCQHHGWFKFALINNNSSTIGLCQEGPSFTLIHLKRSEQCDIREWIWLKPVFVKACAGCINWKLSCFTHVQALAVHTHSAMHAVSCIFLQH